VQVWLARRTRRLLNPLLALASLLTAAATLWFAVAVLDEREELRAAKSDAYDSLHVLFEARAAVNTIRADLSLWLLDAAARPAAAERIAAALHALIATDIARPEQTRPLLKTLQDLLVMEQHGEAAAAMAATPHVGGFLGAELENVTFGVPEREGATQSIARLIDAMGVARAIQRQALAGEHGTGNGQFAAVARWLDETGGGGRAAFDAEQAALDRTIAVNQGEFDRDVTAALATAAVIPFVTCGALALAALLAVAGLWPRLREYR
jgi:hypothetical protein